MAYLRAVFAVSVLTAVLCGCGQEPAQSVSTDRMTALSEQALVRLISEQTEQSCSGFSVRVCADGIRLSHLLDRVFRTRALCRTGMDAVAWESGQKADGRTVTVRIRYTAPAEELNRQKQALRKYASAFAASVCWMQPQQAALTAYDRVLRESAYHPDGVYADTAYGALVCGEADCSGYAEAYLLLCEYAQIPCILITGTAGGIPHAWNLVYLDGSWYHADPAWDDADAETDYRFFLGSDGQFAETHRWNQREYPAAAGALDGRDIIRSLLDSAG